MTSFSMMITLASFLTVAVWTAESFTPHSRQFNRAFHGDGGVSRASKTALKSGLILPGSEDFESLEMVGDESGVAAGTYVKQEKNRAESLLEDKLRSIKIPDKSRPQFGLAQATGRPTEYAFGAECPKDESSAKTFAIRCEQAGVDRVVVVGGSAYVASAFGCLTSAEGGNFASGMVRLICSLELATHRRISFCQAQDIKTKTTIPADTHTSSLFFLQICSSQAVAVDLSKPGSKEVALAALGAAKDAKQKAVVCCADGARLTSLVLGAHVMGEYGANPEEASDMLQARVKHTGVRDRVVVPELLEAFASKGFLEDLPAQHELSVGGGAGVDAALASSMAEAQATALASSSFSSSETNSNSGGGGGEPQEQRLAEDPFGTGGELKQTSSGLFL